MNQAFEESNTANILLCLSAEASPFNLQAVPSVVEDPVSSAGMPLNGNIIDQLRHKVRSEAAECFKAKGGFKFNNGSQGDAPYHDDNNSDDGELTMNCGDNVWKRPSFDFAEGKKSDDLDVIRYVQCSLERFHQ